VKPPFAARTLRSVTDLNVFNDPSVAVPQAARRIVLTSRPTVSCGRSSHALPVNPPIVLATVGPMPHVSQRREHSRPCEDVNVRQPTSAPRYWRLIDSRDRNSHADRDLYRTGDRNRTDLCTAQPRIHGLPESCVPWGRHILPGKGPAQIRGKRPLVRGIVRLRTRRRLLRLRCSY
jgi:hypothetical protein